MTEEFPIVDAHQHFWDPRRATTTRGSATSRRSRSVTATTARFAVPTCQPTISRTRASPHRRRRSTSKRSGTRATRSARWLTSKGCVVKPACRRSPSRRRGSTATTSPRSSSARPRSPSSAACGTSRGQPFARRRCAAAAWPIRDGGAASRCSRGTACASICRRPGGTWTRPPRSPAGSRKRRSSSTTPACRRTAAPTASPAGGARWRMLAACPNAAVKISGLGVAGQTLDGGGEPGDRADDDRALRRRPLHVREQFPGRRPVRHLRRDLLGFREMVRDFRRASSAGSSTTTRCASTAWSDE